MLLSVYDVLKGYSEFCLGTFEMLHRRVELERQLLTEMNIEKGVSGDSAPVPRERTQAAPEESAQSIRDAPKRCEGTPLAQGLHRREEAARRGARHALRAPV